MESLKAALQVTIARFSSPKRVPYDGNGVAPDELVENSLMMPNQQYDRAFLRAQEKAQMPPMSLKMPPLR